jgi:hypothetical protein
MSNYQETNSLMGAVDRHIAALTQDKIVMDEQLPDSANSINISVQKLIYQLIEAERWQIDGVHKGDPDEDGIRKNMLTWRLGFIYSCDKGRTYNQNDTGLLFVAVKHRNQPTEQNETQVHFYRNSYYLAAIQLPNLPDTKFVTDKLYNDQLENALVLAAADFRMKHVRAK